MSAGTCFEVVPSGPRRSALTDEATRFDLIRNDPHDLKHPSPTFPGGLLERKIVSNIPPLKHPTSQTTVHFYSLGCSGCSGRNKYLGCRRLASERHRNDTGTTVVTRRAA